MGELYKLTFPNGKLYIGVSAHGARRRFLRHEANTKINGLYLPVCAAWRKHGAPTMKVLAVIEDSLLYETEIRAIASYGTFVPGGYNLTRGGEGPLGRIVLAESRAKMSAAKKGIPRGPFTAEHRSRIGAVHRGKVVSPESRAKMSKAKKGKPLSPEHRVKISAALYGRTVSPETRAKIGAANSIALKGRKCGPLSPEQRAKLRAARLGKPLSKEHKAKLTLAWIARRMRGVSQETRAKMSAALKGRIHSPEARTKISAAHKRRTVKQTNATGELYANDHPANC